MFFDDPPRAFANLARWLVPGGRFAFAVWGPLAGNPWMTVVRDVVAEIVEVARGDPPGFAGIEVRDFRGSMPVGGGLPPADAARFALAAFASFGDLLAQADAAAQERAQRSLTDVFSRHAPEGDVRIDIHVHIVTGTR
jgi:SAM-dependent methyltransferase